MSGWLKTDPSEGQTRLRVWEWLFTPANLTREYLSAPVSGKSEGTKVAVEFTAEGPRTYCMSGEVVAEGEGTVWLDEVLVETI